MEELVQRLKKRKFKLSNLENQVLEYILANTKEVSNLTIQQLAKELYLSTATISRTAQHLGFQGFQELKYAIQQYAQQEKANKHQVVGLSQNLTILRREFQTSLQNTFLELTVEQVDQAVAMIKQGETIEVIGVGGSLATAMDTARKLTFLGKKAMGELIGMSYAKLRKI